MVKLCIKCGLEGHTNRTCKGPVTSFGLIVFSKGKKDIEKGRIYPHQVTTCPVHNPEGKESRSKTDLFMPKRSTPDEILFLLVERKDTVGFLNIVQGAYPEIEPYRTKKINRFLGELTCEEREKLTTWAFVKLWEIAGSDKKNVDKAQAKFSNLNIEHLISNSTCHYEEADFLMPKGRLKYGENTRQCALREFSEETGYHRNDVDLLDVPPYTEQFTGTDGKMYRNVFYVARLREDARINTRLGDDPNQTKEVRNIGWFNLEECKQIMRDYHQDKKNILEMVHTSLSRSAVGDCDHSNRWQHRWRSVNFAAATWNPAAKTNDAKTNDTEKNDAKKNDVKKNDTEETIY